MPAIDLKLLIWGGGGALFLFAGLLISLYIMANWDEIKKTITGNSLVWIHPDNPESGLTTLDIKHFKNPCGPQYPYRSFWFLPEKRIYWVYEVKTEDYDPENPTFDLKPYLPDKHIDFSGVKSDELADALDWRPAKRLLAHKAKVMEKLAQGGIIVMGCASLFGIMMLLDMLNKPV